MSSIKLLNADQVAAEFGITATTLRRWVKLGKFPVPLNIGEHTTRWRESTISQWLDEQSSSEDPESAELDLEADDIASALENSKRKRKKNDE